MKIIVCGGRDFTDRAFVIQKLDELSLEWPKTPEDKYGNWLPAVKIITGGARGVDTFAADWAAVNWTSYKEYKADWKKWRRAAGPIRNEQMLREEQPDLVVAFPGGQGTAHMVRIARAAGVKVVEISS